MPTAVTRRRDTTPSAAAIVGVVAEKSVPADPRGLSDDDLARRLFCLAKSLAGRRANYPGLDPDDALAATWSELWLKAREWDSGRGTTATTYAVSCATWAWTRTRREGVLFGPRSFAGPRPERVPLADRSTDDGPAVGHEPAARDAEPAVHPADLAEWQRHCDPRAWSALSAVTLEGLTLAEAGQRLGVSRERARQLADRAADQIRTALIRKQVAGRRGKP